MRSLLLILLGIFLISASSDALGRRQKASIARPSGITTEDALQKILFYEDRRVPKADFLVKSLGHPSERVRKAAVLALGRIGDNIGLDEMARILSKKDVDLRIHTAFALSLIPDENAAKILSQNFPMHKEAQTRAALIENMGRTGGENTVKLLSDTLNTEPNSRLFPSIYESLGLLWSRDSENWTVPPGLLSRLARAAQSRGGEATLAAFALARFKGTAAMLPTDEVLNAAANAASEFPRAFLTRVAGKIHTPASLALLVKGAANLSSLAVRIEAVKALGSQEPTPECLQALNTAFGDAYQHVVFEALVAAGKLGPKAATLSPAILSLWNSSRSTWIKGTALKTLSHVDPTAARAEVTKTLSNASSPNLTEAVAALGILGQAADVQKLATYLTNTNILVAGAAAEGLSLVDGSLIGPDVQAALKMSLDRTDANLTTVVAQIAAQQQWKDFSSSFVTIYPRLNAVEHLEAKVAVLTTLGLLGDGSTANLVLQATNEKEKIVIEAAAKSYKQLTGKDVSDKIPLNSKIEAPAPLYSAVSAAAGTRVVLKTTRGEIHLKMVSDAPVTAYNFLKLVRSGFYTNKVFHRVVPNFVVQGGDPRGDGFGGPGYLIRDEVSRKKHERGTVGIATAGKDTGGSQFFFNLAPNFHLNGRYTIFAEVTQGMAVADKLEAGDKILSAKIY